MARFFQKHMDAAIENEKKKQKKKDIKRTINRTYLFWSN